MDQGHRGRSYEELDPQHRAVLAVLDDADEPVQLNELADRLVKRDETVLTDEEYEDAVEREVIVLHHTVLPRLAETRLVEYDRESNVVSTNYDGVADRDWQETDSIADALSNLRSDGPADTDPIGVLTGRQAAIEYGRALAAEATDELFCMYVGTDLLEDECLRHAEDAIARGVELYVGSRDEDVRALTRRHLPEATIWEPVRGWLNPPAGYPKVGRLVLADRKKVMLAVLEEPDPDGAFPHEQAMVGEGEDNPLVVLVRELLGPRLDHLDFQSANFRSELHP